jgi:hypothetical protein
MDIQTLGLVNEGAAADGEVDDFLLTDFPDCFKDLAALLWDFCDVLD